MIKPLSAHPLCGGLSLVHVSIITLFVPKIKHFVPKKMWTNFDDARFCSSTATTSKRVVVPLVRRGVTAGAVLLPIYHFSLLS
jgi:hypothetical protein